MIKIINDFLNSITMYRLMLYYLILLFAASILFSLVKILPFNPANLIFSMIFLTAVCLLTNRIFARLLKVPTNLESVYITAMILTLIVPPPGSLNDLIILTAIGFISQAGKYLLAIGRKHIFNPAAFAVSIAYLLNFGAASWWVGSIYLLPFVLFGGFLIIKKVQRYTLFFSFLIASLALTFGSTVIKGANPLPPLINIAQSHLFFFVFVMLTEPLTTPPVKKLQLIYGGLTGILFNFYTPEISLLAGNLFSYLVSPKGKFLLTLKEKIKTAPSIYDFVFNPDRKVTFKAGQYLEWTLEHKNPDSRGNRRYFTIAASPSEDDLRIGVKFNEKGSSFKKALIAFKKKDKIMAGSLSGEFTMPKDADKKLCFFAGGIGITPFRSMIKYLLDIKEKRDIIIFYAAKSSSEFVYKDIFDRAKILGININYITGRIDADLIKTRVPDAKKRIFYISGPHSMVDAFQKTLKELGISDNQIKIDFFPGYV